MKLQQKISLSFLLIVSMFGIGNYLVVTSTLVPTFDELESRAARNDVVRALNGLASLQMVLGNLAADWAHWDDAYEFALGNNARFVETNLAPDTLTNLNLSMMMLYDRSGELLWGVCVDNETGESSSVVDGLLSANTISLLQRHDSAQSKVDGIAESSAGPVMLSSRPIVHSDQTGPIEGSLIIGHVLNSNRVKELMDLTAVDISLSPTVDASIQDKSSDFVWNIPGDLSQEITSDARISHISLNDVHQSPLMTLSVTSPRDIANLGQNTLSAILYSVAGVGIIMIMGIWILISYLVIRPIDILEKGMSKIHEHGSLSKRVDMHRSDEIGKLAQTFNSMIFQLDELKQRLIEQSFKAGVAEVATGVLHNVRNSLMPIVNSIAYARDHMSRPTNQCIGRAIEELNSSNLTCDRKEKLLAYLSHSHLETVGEKRLGEQGLDNALQQLDQVMSVVREQEQFSHAEPVLESVNLGEVFQSAAHVISRHDKHRNLVHVENSVADYNVQAHRTLLIQVFSNVLLNAYESIIRGNMEQGRIDVRACYAARNDETVVQIIVSDTGIGIRRQDCQAVFDRGFTSKREGKGGLGLHWSANALAGMHASIAVDSEGLGRGAQVSIYLVPTK